MKNDSAPATHPELHKSWKDRYVIGLLFIIGTVYLVTWLISIFSETGSFVNVEQGNLTMSLSELLNHVRTVLTIIFSLAGAIFLIRGSRSGIVAGTAIFALFLVIVSGGLYQAIQLGEVWLLGYALLAFLILLTGLIFLWLPTTSRRLGVTRKTRMLAVGMSIFLALFYFVVQ